MNNNISIPITQNITPAAAQEVLANNGLTVSVQEAAAVVEFLYILAGSTVQHGSSN